MVAALPLEVHVFRGQSVIHFIIVAGHAPYFTGEKNADADAQAWWRDKIAVIYKIKLRGLPMMYMFDMMTVDIGNEFSAFGQERVHEFEGLLGSW